MTLLSMRFFSAFCLLFAVSLTYGQKYFVFDIEGEVLTSGQPLSIKSVITADTELTFIGADAALHVISLEGKQLIAPDRLPAYDQDQYIGFVKDAIHPPYEYRSSVTRANGTELQLRNLAELKSFFRYEVLIFDTTAYLVEALDFPLDSIEDHYYIFYYPPVGRVSWS